MRPDTVSELKSAQPRRGEILAWLIILVVVVVLIAGNAMRATTARADQPVNDLRMKMLAQEAIGTRSFSGGQSVRVMQEITSEARSPEDNVREAIVAGYLEGRAAALSKLTALNDAQSTPETRQDIATLMTMYKAGSGRVHPAEARRLTRRYGY